MANKNITMKQYNGTDYDVLYPATTVEQVDGAQPASTAITTSNISSQSVNYANTAGSAPASDVYSWAKAANKPSYTYSEVGACSSTDSRLSDARTPTSHNQAASTITAGTFAGQVVANSGGETYSTYCLRNQRLASSDTNPTVNGEICWTYS